MCVADQVIIETQKNNFRGAQSWKLIDGIPKRKREQPEMSVDGDFTIVSIKLGDEYKSKFNREFVEKTLQKFYPTILSGAKVNDKNGKKRQLTMTVNSAVVNPPSEIDYEKKKPLEAKVNGVDVTGYVFLAKEGLNEEDQGIKIIVNGRKITKDFFGVYGSKNEKITGYLHADILIDDLAGDKTSIKKVTTRWRQLSEAIGKQLIKFMKEIGAIREEKLPEKMIKQIHLEINDLLKHFPELQELAKRAGISLSGNILIPKYEGDISTKLETGSKLDRGVEPGSGGGGGIPLQPGTLPDIAPSNKTGETKAIAERRKRRGLIVWPRPEETIRKEAWFSPGEGMVIVNSLFPTYKKAEKMDSLSYHMLRCAIEALLNHAAEIGVIETEKLTEYRNDVLAKWGEL